MESEHKATLGLVGMLVFAFLCLASVMCVSSYYEEREKTTRIEAILRSGDCKTLAAELSK
ncbi:MAG: hypothetical protein IPK60_21110 [Sandaracinaceae bacterium]|nr:hypothetical protein [Sandaracinaceae bacterium]